MTEDTDLFLTLKEDYREALEQLNDLLLRLETTRGDRDALEDAARQLHNIKGFANRMGAPRLGKLAHMLEDVIGAVDEGRLPFDESAGDVLFQGLDLFVSYLRSREVPDGKVAALVESVEARLFGAPEEDDAATQMEELLPDFVAAARDNVEAINQGLVDLGRDPANTEALQEVYRNAHSLKGSAQTMGFERMGKLAHCMEDVLRAFQEGRLAVTTEACDALFEVNDAVSVMLDTLAAGKRVKVDVESRMTRLAGFLSQPEHEGETVATERARKVVEPSPSVWSAPAVDTVRVATARLDELVNLTGEALIAQIRLDSELEALDSICTKWERLHLHDDSSLWTAEQDGEIRSDLVGEVVSLGKSLAEATRRLQEAVENTGRHIELLQHRTMEIRMLPLALVFNTLPRAVRDLSRQFGKEVRFLVTGEQTTIDKRILEQIGDPLIHLLRNALDHGMERPATRRQCGKPAKGTIRLEAHQEGSKVIIALEDDGRGIDPQRIKETAIRKKFVDEDQVRDWSEAQLLELIFQPGLSTSTLVTDVSGRGVGMDVVRANVERLKGEVHVSSEPGKGTRFVVFLPLTLATVHALMIQCAGEVLAIPTFSVVKTLQFPRREIKNIQGRQAIVHQEEVFPLRDLAAVLGWQDGLGKPPSGDGALMLVILQAGERRLAFVVEEILGEREIVTKDLGSHLRKVQFVAGATILGSGQVALIVDVPQVLSKEEPEVRREAAIEEVGEPRPRHATMILVVEDQVVTRQMEKSILEAAGYQVITAENGLDALNKLGQHTFDLVVTDVQMPKMDGFALTREIRAEERTRHLPVVVLTAMEREQDKRRGLEVGADAYLVKSGFDQRNLIDTVETLLGGKPPRA
jgi:two-component system chemotaxis sensor kinase CheA